MKCTAEVDLLPVILGCFSLWCLCVLYSRTHERKTGKNETTKGWFTISSSGSHPLRSFPNKSPSCCCILSCCNVRSFLQLFDLRPEYVTKVIATVRHFCNALLTRLCMEERVKTALWSLLVDELLERYRKLVEHIRFLLQTERSGNLLTTNHYFSETLDKLRSERSAEPTESFSFGSSNATQRASVDNLEHTVRDIHNILKAYYKVARKRFVDNVCLQGTDYYLITGPEIPLRVFSPQFVVELSDERLGAVAGEDITSVQQRKSVEKDVESLTEGRRILIA